MKRIFAEGDSVSESLVREGTGQQARRGGRLPYIPGLDGLRAIAVVAVLLYHAGLNILGGFLGVESFFVLSGFLITALLLAEWREHGRVSLRGFWLRRARRLLPALFLLLAGALLYTIVLLPRETAEVRADTVAALAYVMNWHLILSGQSYFDPLLRPPLLQNLWSLAVEEQFYLLWPLLFVAGMRLLRVAGLLVVTLVAALGSALLMAALYRPGLDPSRIYYGTDTRAVGLLLGAALALIWMPGKAPSATDRRLGLLLDCAGTVALAGLIACFVFFSEQHPLLYRGGFALVSAITVIVIAAVTHPGARLVPWLLGWQPLRWIGMRSYGIYLWHWPVFMVTRPYVDLPLAGLPLLALRLAIVGALVELSYRYIEMPVRRGSMSWRRLWIGQDQSRPSPARLPRSITTVRWLYFLIPGLLLLSVGAASSRRQVSQVAVPQRATAITASRRGVETPTAPFLAVSPTVAMAARSTRPTVVPETTVGIARPTVIADAATKPMPTAAVVIPTQTAQAISATAPVAATPPAAPRPLDPALVAELQYVLDSTVADGFIPGAVLSIDIPGYIPWSGASGMADLRRGLPMEPDTLVHIASITKMFTAVVILQLVEEGKIELDTPIGVWLPDVVLFEETTTVRHLLSHTTGIYDYLEDRRFFVAAYQNPDRIWAPTELASTKGQIGPAFKPGAEGQWKYSSTNYVILGMLVEQITGRTLAEEMRQRIFGPLDLKQTFFAPDEAPQGMLAHGYIDESDRSDVSMTFVFATGNIISTADDLRRFADGLFDGRLLHPQSLGLMTALIDTGGAYDMPELEYGLGVMAARLNVGPDPDGIARPDAVSSVLGHIGGIAGFRSAVWRAPESGITIALSLNQADTDPNLLARDVLDAILTWQGR